MGDKHTISRFSDEDRRLLETLDTPNISPFDLLPHRDKREKLVDLVLNGVPSSMALDSATMLGDLRERLVQADVSDVKVVVFGGGTGLSNIIGGDSRHKNWTDKPFEGLKKIFPSTRAIVCVTDDGGSTGELLKDVPVIGLGDIRHVMVSSIQSRLLEQKYNLSKMEAVSLVKEIASIFNYRFAEKPESAQSLLKHSRIEVSRLPAEIATALCAHLEFCFQDKVCSETLGRHHCLGNLLLLSAIRQTLTTEIRVGGTVVMDESSAEAMHRAISNIGQLFGTDFDAVLPCTTTPAQLRFRYGDGVEVTGEHKSSIAERNVAIDQVTVDFCGPPHLSDQILHYIGEADVLIMAPGSLYSSIIPVMQVPGIAEAVRENGKALKLLIANLWVQEGETDKAIADPDRKFQVSDMIRAYEHNLPGGVAGLFDQILCLSMQEVPGSVIQNYAVEGKNPIYLDRELLKQKGFTPIECGFFSRSAMLERGVIQHDPEVVAQTVKTLFLANELFGDSTKAIRLTTTAPPLGSRSRSRLVSLPSFKYKKVIERLSEIGLDLQQCDSTGLQKEAISSTLADIIWSHQDITVSHLDLIDGVTFISAKNWRRDQRWDNVFSFYDPEDRQVKIREDRLWLRKNLEVSFLIALGQALLGDYAETKLITPQLYEGKEIGSVYHLSLKSENQRRCYFSDRELRSFLILARMTQQTPTHFTRTINGAEGFTPPGLLMGLMYAWYLDNRLSSHIEYKMAIFKVRPTELIPEQKKMVARRKELIGFFRESVFGRDSATVKD